MNLAFLSVEHIMRDVNYGFLLRYAHANGASFFFFCVYLHIARGLYYGSYRSPRNSLWIIGVIIFIVIIGTAFLGYVIVWGQMSLWGNLFVPQMLNFNSTSNLFYTIPFIRPRTKANERIGPHDEDVTSVIIGSMLGDCHGEKHGNGSRFRFQQEDSHMEYFIWIHKFFKLRGYCSETGPKIKTRSGENNIRYYYSFRTFTFTSFDWIREMFYPNGVKCVPKEIDQYLTPLALAIWIQDDGGKVSSGLKIATNPGRATARSAWGRFTLEDVDYLCKVLPFWGGNRPCGAVLNNKYQFDARPQSAGVSNQYVIYISKSSIITLSKLVPEGEPRWGPPRGS